MVIGILLSLILLTFIAYRGLSVILFAPVCALLAAITAGLPVMPTYTELFMVKAVTYIKNFFPVFMLGAVFGKIMEESGCARAIAKYFAEKLGARHAVVAVAMSTALLTYGGVSMFVVPFAVYPFAYVLFRDANIPRRLIPASIALGSFCFSMTAMPGSPQIQNMIPANYFGTTLYAGPILGLTGAAIMCFGGLAWLKYRERKLIAAGEGFGRPDDRASTNLDDGLDMHPCLAVLPLLTVLGLNVVLTFILREWSPVLMESTKALPLASAKVPVANWALIISLVIGILLAVAVSRKQFRARKNLFTAMNVGTIGSLLAIMNTASEVGYGNVISSLPGFTVVRDFLLGIDPGTPLVSEALTINVLAGITGSASGGMSIALEAMGQRYLEWGAQVGIGPELLHRVAAMASGGFDSLPHNGAIITLLAITGMSHRESYPDIGMITVVLPFVTTFGLVAVWSIFGFTM